MKKTNKNMNTSMGMGMCFGVAAGSALGVVFDNIALGVAIGTSIGLAIGTIIGSKKDEIVNKQIEEKGYIIKEITPKDNKEYLVIIEDTSGEIIEIVVPEGQTPLSENTFSYRQCYNNICCLCVNRFSDAHIFELI